MTLAIETRQLSFAFHKNKKVVDNLSLQVPKGSIYGFLGPNGAGKTTTIRLLTGMLLPEIESVFINGLPLHKNIPHIFEKIGALIETPSLYLHLSAKENLRIIATLRGLTSKKIDDVLAIVGLSQVATRKVNEFSLGMKQRLGIAMALLPDPDLLILDEPANGLDPTGIIEIRELLIKLNQQDGKTIFVSSHLLNEVEKTCTHIAIINRGILCYEGSLNQMKNDAYASSEVIFKIPEANGWLNHLQQKFPLVKQTSQDEIVFPASSQSEVATINHQLTAMDIPVAGIQLRGGLEEWFINIIQKDKQLV